MQERFRVTGEIRRWRVAFQAARTHTTKEDCLVTLSKIREFSLYELLVALRSSGRAKSSPLKSA